MLDELAVNDNFVKARLYKILNELSLTNGIDYNDHYNSAFDVYNETVIYYLLQRKGFDIEHVPEETMPTPDFKVTFNAKNWDRKDVIKSIFIEVKSLSFADGIYNIKRCNNLL